MCAILPVKSPTAYIKVVNLFVLRSGAIWCAPQNLFYYMST